MEEVPETEGQSDLGAGGAELRASRAPEHKERRLGAGQVGSWRHGVSGEGAAGR